MGQYYLIVNISKKQYLDPFVFADGRKLMEFASSGMGVLTGLALLLADGNGRGGGDLDSDNPIVGSWAGDRIVIAGDYADAGKFLEQETIRKGHENDNLHTYADFFYTDISEQVIRAMIDDDYVREKLEKRAKEYEEANIYEDYWLTVTHAIEDRKVRNMEQRLME